MNASSHMTDLQLKWKVLTHPPYSPDLFAALDRHIIWTILPQWLAKRQTRLVNSFAEHPQLVAQAMEQVVETDDSYIFDGACIPMISKGACCK